MDRPNINMQDITDNMQVKSISLNFTAFWYKFQHVILPYVCTYLCYGRHKCIGGLCYRLMWLSQSSFYLRFSTFLFLYFSFFLLFSTNKIEKYKSQKIYK